MTAKLYELPRMLEGKFQLTFVGQNITVRFRPGFSAAGKRVGQLRTDNPLVQDAIENDPRFGTTFILRAVYSDRKQEQEEEQQLMEEQPERAPERPQKSKAEIYAENQARKAAKQKAIAGLEQHPEIRNRSDVTAFFAERGEIYDGRNFDVLCAKYGVEFPNFKKE